MYKAGQEVLITITDRDVEPPLVTTCRGVVTDPLRNFARVTDGHPVWHNCEVRCGRGIKFKSEPRDAIERLGVKEWVRPVQCYYCRRQTTLATKAPHQCFECCLGEDGKRS